MRKFFIISLIAVFAIGVVLTGCTRYANKEQLNKLDQTEQAVVAAEKTLADKQTEQAQLEKDLAKKQNELEAKKAEKVEIRKKLGK
jgi:septal ring factor EnvC (AmiA/AmiB activator)